MLDVMKGKLKKKKEEEVAEEENEILEEEITKRDHLETKPIVKTKPSKDAFLIKIEEKIRSKIVRSMKY